MTFKISGSSVGGLRLKNTGGIPIAAKDPTGMSDLVAWYKADSLGLSNGATVTSWPDDSPNNNDLNSYESAPTYNSSDAILGGMPSVTYDGNDSNYRSNPTGLPVGSSACTTYVVGYWSGASSTADMFTWGSNAYTGARMGAGYYSGMIFENGGIGTLARSVSANQPFIFSYPYVAGANVTEAVSYLDGVSAAGSNMGQSGVPSISNPVAEIVIGRPATAPTERWTGAVAEVLVFNTTHDEVTRGRIERYLANKYGISITPVKTPGKLTNRIGMSAPSIVTSGLVMRLDAGNASSYPGSGTTWTDLSGQGNNATLTNGPTYDSGNGGSIIFDGSDDYAPTTANGFSFGSSPGTISCWAKTATILGSWSWIFAYGTPSLGASRFLGINGSDYYVGGYGADITASGVPLNTWFNMVGVYDGTNASMYINGTLVSGPTPQSWNTVSSVSVVGRQTNNSEYWNGNIAQVLVYDRDLTAGEILQNFNVDKSRFGL